MFNMFNIKRLFRQQRQSTPAPQTPPVSQDINEAVRAAWKARQQGNPQVADKALRELHETIQRETP